MMKLNLTIVFLFVLVGCSVSDVGFEATKEQESRYLSSYSDGVDRLIVKGSFESSGYFIQLVHPHKSKLELFVPCEDGEIKYRAIIKRVSESSDASNWPFYYCPLGFFSADSIRVENGYALYDDGVTNIAANNLFDWKQMHRSGFEVYSMFVPRAKFCVAKVGTEEINHWNFDDKIQDGPEERDLDKNFFYMFDEKVDSIAFLLPSSNYCN